MSVEELEIVRKKAVNKVLIGIVITIIIDIIICLLTKIIFFAFFIFILGLAVTMIASNKSTNEFNKAFKKVFVLKALQSTFDNLIYESEKGLDEDIIRNTQMMDMGDVYRSNDLISATYKNINVIQADVHIKEQRETTDSDGHTQTTYVTIFMGKWMIFDFNKKFKANLQVCQKGFYNAVVNNWGTTTKYQKVMMEDQEFNNNFRIYAQSEHEAFYILTPSLMEKIKKLASSISGQILLCFIDNKLHVGVQNNKDSFEHSIFKKINEEEVMNEISKDIKLITSFVDELDLDNDLFI